METYKHSSQANTILPLEMNWGKPSMMQKFILIYQRQPDNRKYMMLYNAQNKQKKIQLYIYIYIYSALH